VAQRTRKNDAVTIAQEEEWRERLTIMVVQAQAQKAMKMRELLGEAKTNIVTGAASSNRSRHSLKKISL
jgi:hypothetical protein